MGGLLKNGTMQWVSKQAKGEREPRQKRQITRLSFIIFSRALTRFAAHLILQFSPDIRKVIYTVFSSFARSV
jgi:hypothetical protein